MKRIVAIMLLILLSATMVSCQNSPESDFTGQKKSYTEKINGDGTIDRRWYYKYYSTGDVSIAMSCAEDGTCLQRNVYTYNDKHLKTSETIYLQGKKTSYTEFTYTDKGLLLTKITYLPESTTTETYYYNPDGSENYVETANAEGIITGVKRCIYDESGNKIKERFFNGNNQYAGGIEYTFDRTTLILKEYIGNSSTEFSKEEYAYDGDKVVKTLLYNKSGSLAYTDTAEYDGEECVRRVRYNASGDVVYTWNAYFDDFITLIG